MNNKTIEEAAYDYSREADEVLARVDVINAFIAGAEWQMKQGYSLEYLIRYDWGVSDTSTESKKATLSFPLPADLFNGDRVIVQIRKK